MGGGRVVGDDGESVDESFFETIDPFASADCGVASEGDRVTSAVDKREKSSTAVDGDITAVSEGYGTEEVVLSSNLLDRVTVLMGI